MRILPSCPKTAIDSQMKQWRKPGCGRNAISAALLSGLFLGLGPGVPAARPATITLPVEADTFIISSAPDHNAGGNVQLNLGTDGQGGVRRGLLRFNLGAIPAGATITSAVLRLTVVRVPVMAPVDSNFELYRLLADWAGGAQGGSSGAPAAEGEVTWNSRLHNAASWTDPGAASDTEPAPSASRLVTSLSGVTYEWSGALVVRDAQDWLDEPASNFGWLLRSDNEAARRTARAFAALESGDNVATLEIGFRPRVNLPPAVSITSPTNGAVFTNGAIAITAFAADADGGVASVRFFDGASLLGIDTQAPFGIAAMLTNGSHTLTAVAADYEGASTTSAPVVIRLYLLPPPVLRIERAGSDVVIRWDGPYTLEVSPALNSRGASNWMSLPGLSPVRLPVTPAGRRFFRAVHP
jgi:hypothetical protein